jgi:single-strand DNA-binding protein
VDNINGTVAGRIGDAPYSGTTRNGKPMASFSVAAEIPSRIPGGDSDTRWYKVWAYGALAQHVADSLVKGDRVIVRYDDITYRLWTDDSPERKPRAQVELKAYDIGASMRFDNLLTAKAARQGAAPAGGGQPTDDPWADATQAGGGREVPEVLAGVTA